MGGVLFELYILIVLFEVGCLTGDLLFLELDFFIGDFGAPPLLSVFLSFLNP